MNTLTLNENHVLDHRMPPHRVRARGLGWLLIADALLAFAPVAVLGAAIGWPASLDQPAAEQMALIAANADRWPWATACTCCIRFWSRR